MAGNVNGTMFKNNNNKKKSNIGLIAILIALAIGMIVVQYVVIDINNAMYEQLQQEQDKIQAESLTGEGQ